MWGWLLRSRGRRQGNIRAFGQLRRGPERGKEGTGNKGEGLGGKAGKRREGRERRNGGAKARVGLGQSWGREGKARDKEGQRKGNMRV